MSSVRAEHRFARISSSKVNRILPTIRGKQVGEGLEILRTFPNRAARLVEKVLHSAAANAKEAGARNVDNLRIAAAVANPGPMFKRIRAKSRGMAYVERHRSSHISIVIDAPEI